MAGSHYPFSRLLWRHSGGYRQNGLPVPELEAALKNVHDEVRQARHFERMQEMDLFFGEKARQEEGPP